MQDEPEFLANYSDGLTDLPLPAHLEHFRAHNAVASFVSVRPNLSYHVVSTDAWRTRHGHRRDSSRRRSASTGDSSPSAARSSTIIHEGEELVVEPFQRLVAERRLAAYEYDGFWMSMDTFKDRQQLEDIHARGNAPWQVWGESRVAPLTDVYV